MKPRSSIFRFATAATVSRNRMKRNCDEMNREENIEKLLQKILGKQRNPEQMDSVQKMLREHIEASLDKRDLKTVLTKDQKTIELAQKIIADYIKQEGLTEDVQEYLEKMIIAPKEDNVNQKGSITVLIEPIEDSGYEKSWHEQKKLQDQKGKKRMICVGGPSAIDQALLASTIPQIAAQTDVVYISAGHWYSNLVNSALQFHARHGNALNASDALSGHALLASLVARKIIGLINNKAQALEAIENPAYCKIDVKFTLNPEKLRIY